MPRSLLVSDEGRQPVLTCRPHSILLQTRYKVTFADLPVVAKLGVGLSTAAPSSRACLAAVSSKHGHLLRSSGAQVVRDERVGVWARFLAIPRSQVSVAARGRGP